MFKIGDIIAYRSAGVCRVEDIREDSLTGERKTYYFLKPLAKRNATVYVPLDNAMLCGRMMPLLSEADAHALLKKPGDAVALPWVDNPKERQTTFSAAIAGGNRAEIVAVVRALVRHKREVEQEGRKFFASDERLLDTAISAVAGEIAYVLHREEHEIVTQLYEE